MDFENNLNQDTVEQAMSTEPLMVTPQTPVGEVLRLMRDHNTGGALVCQDGVLTGIFTERDSLRLLAHNKPLDEPVEAVMVRDPVTLGRHDTVATAIRTMSSGGYRRLPIVDDQKRPVGIVKVTWVVRYLVEHFPQAVYNLPPEPQPLSREREGA